MYLQEYDIISKAFWPTYHTKSHNTALPIRHGLCGPLIVLVGLQSGVQNPTDTRVSLEPFRKRLRRLAVALAAQFKRLETLQEEPCVEGTHTWTQVSHRVHAELSGECFVAVCLPESHAVVPIGWFGEAGEFAAGGPVEFPAIYNDAAHGCTVPSNPLGATVGDDVGAKGNGSGEVAAHAEGVVDDEGNPRRVSNIRDGPDVGNIVLGVRDGFDVNTPGVFVDSGGDLLRVITHDPLDGDVELLHVHSELVVGTAV